MIITLQRGIDALPIGQLARTDQADTLEESQISVYRGKAMTLRGLLQTFIQLLACELDICLAQSCEQSLLPGAKGLWVLIGGRSGTCHGLEPAA